MVPFPSWPELLLPQAHTVPSLLSPRLWLPPVASALTPGRPRARIGAVALVVAPFPSWPLLSSPQAQAVLGAVARFDTSIETGLVRPLPNVAPPKAPTLS